MAEREVKALGEYADPVEAATIRNALNEEADRLRLAAFATVAERMRYDLLRPLYVVELHYLTKGLSSEKMDGLLRLFRELDSKAKSKPLS